VNEREDDAGDDDRVGAAKRLVEALLNHVPEEELFGRRVEEEDDADHDQDHRRIVADVGHHVVFRGGQGEHRDGDGHEDVKHEDADNARDGVDPALFRRHPEVDIPHPRSVTAR